MSFYEIYGAHRLEGALTVQGAKNSVLPILTATLLIPGESVIHNCPALSDVEATLDILRTLGCQTQRQGSTVTVNASAPCRSEVPDCLARKMRSSVLFLGALLARMGEAELSMPGGCDLGSRPIDLHLAALRQLGAAIQEERGRLICRTKRTATGQELYLPLPSVGATENIMLAACRCPGVTTVVGAAREPEITDLQNFLCSAGAEISGAGESVLTIRGGRPLHGTEYTVMGDRIVAATYLCAAACAGGKICLRGVHSEHLNAVRSALEEAGCRIQSDTKEIVLSGGGKLRGIRPVRTAPYPGFPTDAQALLMAALAGGTGSTMFVENLFDSRYRHVDELVRMGAKIQTNGRTAIVTGTGKLHGARVHSPDLRGGAALAVAALGAEGTTQLHGLGHIRRGYDRLEQDLRALGAEIRRIDGPNRGVQE